MADDFQYDVLLSHRSKDKSVVRPLAERLRGGGLRVWFDEWVLKPGDSRVLALCMSVKPRDFKRGATGLAHRAIVACSGLQKVKLSAVFYDYIN